MTAISWYKVNCQNGNRFYQYFATAAISIMLLNSGMHYAWSSPSLEKLQEEDSPIKITNSEGSWLAVMTLIGSVLGSAVVSVTVDILGRKRAVLLSGPLYFLSWILIAYAESINVLYIARFTAGVTDSLLFASSTMYIAEISDAKIRGFLLSISVVNFIGGLLLINLVGSYFSIKVTALLSSSLPVISVLSFSWMPETPYAWLMKDNHENAKLSLQFFKNLKDVESDLDRISTAIKTQSHKAAKWLDLFTVKSNRKATIVIVILRGVQIFSGSTFIILYTQTIFREAGGSVSPVLASVIYSAVQFILCILSSSIVDVAGRRPLLMISIFGSAIALFVEGTYFLLKSHTDIDVENYSYVSLIALLSYVVLFSSGMQVIPFLMLGELFPTNIKAFALCLADIYFAVAAIISSKFFQIMKDNYGMYVPFYTFAVISLVGLVCIYIKVPETKGKTLEEIQQHLRGEVISKAED